MASIMQVKMDDASVMGLLSFYKGLDEMLRVENMDLTTNVDWLLYVHRNVRPVTDEINKMGATKRSTSLIRLAEDLKNQYPEHYAVYIAKKALGINVETT